MCELSSRSFYLSKMILWIILFINTSSLGIFSSIIFTKLKSDKKNPFVKTAGWTQNKIKLFFPNYFTKLAVLITSTNVRMKVKMV